MYKIPGMKNKQTQLSDGNKIILVYYSLFIYKLRSVYCKFKLWAPG